MKKLIATLKNEDWVIVYAGAIILLLATLFPEFMPSMPKKLESLADLSKAGFMFVSILGLTYLCQAVLRRPMKGIFLSLLTIFVLSLAAQVVANIPLIKTWGLESVFFSVIFGLIVSNCFGTPQWLKPAIQSEFYIKIGIVCLGSTILFGEVMKSGVFGLAQALIVVFTVWFFAFRNSMRMTKDREMSTMIASSVSICGVSAAIATSGVIKGDNKKLSYVISLVLVCAIPMMYIMPWVADLLGLSEEVAGAWLGGTIDTTGAVAASGTMLGETAAQTAIIVKSSQNVLLGVAAFLISLMWTYQGKQYEEKPTLGVIWDRFPKFVVGFILASLVFSFLMDVESAKAVGKITKGFTNTLFSIAFVCVGLETRFADIFSKENRKPLWAFLLAQGFNIIVTLVVAYLLFGIVKPMLA
ncbi:MAG: putative sulfate exporter family transporter [Alistipes sp.]|nr:putative sulfate exporter family transporter [Alistipes sp.]MBQ8545130.1 putative sulfate exporter family transporter [Alistipes sp.]